MTRRKPAQLRQIGRQGVRLNFQGRSGFCWTEDKINLILAAARQVGELAVGTELIEDRVFKERAFAQPRQYAGDAVIVEVELTPQSGDPIGAIAVCR